MLKKLQEILNMLTRYTEEIFFKDINQSSGDKNYNVRNEK